MDICISIFSFLPVNGCLSGLSHAFVFEIRRAVCVQLFDRTLLSKLLISCLRVQRPSGVSMVIDIQQQSRRGLSSVSHSPPEWPQPQSRSPAIYLPSN